MSKLTTFSKFAIAIGALMTIPFIVIYGSFAWGFVFMKLYYWFITPIFTGLPVITLYQFMGLGVVISTIVNLPTQTEVKPELKAETNWFSLFLKPWGMLFFAWLVYLFIN